jgi:adenosylcobinamide-GDP ribazoletransferase
VSGLGLALRYLTVLPAPGGGHDAPDRLGRAAGWFPVVGLLLGVLLVVVDRVVSGVFPSLAAAVLTVAAWKVLTGGLHLDGLADTVDGLAGHDPEHRLAIMRDSRIGTFGTVSLVLLLLLEVVAVAALPPPVRWRVLLAAPVIARATPPVLARCFRPARADGHGAAFASGVRALGVVLALGVALPVAFLTLGAAGVAATLLALLVTGAAVAFVSRRLGGVTGDVLGAAVELAELTVVLTVLAWLGAQA